MVTISGLYAVTATDESAIEQDRLFASVAQVLGVPQPFSIGVRISASPSGSCRPSA
jgi:hypothetical protein